MLSKTRLRVGAIAGAIVAIAALIAVPTAASAAETQQCVTAPTAATQPWQTFVDGGNAFATLNAAFATAITDGQTQLDLVGPLTTQVELDAVVASFGASMANLGEVLQNSSLEESFTALQAGLLAADPANEATWSATLEAIGQQLDQASNGIDFNGAFELYITNASTFLDDAQAALDALPPTAPTTVPPAVAASGAALLDVVSQLVQVAQVNLYDAAAAQVVLEEVCTTVTTPDEPVVEAAVETTVLDAAPQLANTGTADAPLLGAAAALFLLLGATASVLVARRRAS
jgi:LPXTG-motif cell wall-anchored protein